MKISFFFLSQIPTTKTQKYLKKKNVVEDVSLSLRKEQLSKPKDFLPKPTENCREREASPKESVWVLSAFFLTKILNILKKGDSFQEFLFSAALFSVSSDPEFPAGDHAGAPNLLPGPLTAGQEKILPGFSGVRLLLAARALPQGPPCEKVG